MRINLSTLALGVAFLGGCSSSTPSKPAVGAGAGAGATGGNEAAAGSPGGGGSPASGGSKPVGGVSVAVMPTVAHTAPEGTVQFTATVTGSANQEVAWSVEEGASGGSIDADGLYTAPKTAGSYHIVATSHAQAKAMGKASVSVNVVGDCANLPAAGTWENISPPAAVVDASTFSKGFSEAVIVDPFNPATVWLTVGYQGLFKSTNCGSTWTHVNTGRGAAAIDRGSHVSIQIDPVNQGTMYMISIFDAWGFWKSTNGGVDWDQMWMPGSDVTKATNNFADAISMDPTDPRHMVVNFHTNCEGEWAPACEAETKDGGETWRLFKTPNSGWEEGAGAWVLGPTTWLYGGLELYYTDDSGATWEKVTPKGSWAFSGGEVATHPIPRAPDGTYLLTSSQGLVTSPDGHVWTLLPDFARSVVSFAVGDDSNLFTSDQWSPSYFHATGGDWKKWTKIAPPEGTNGAPYLDYDAHYKVLYSSTFGGGTWRTVIP